MCLLKIVLLMIFGWLSAEQAVAQHKIQRSVFGTGATTTGDNNNRIQGTLGQPLIGQASGTTYSTGSGFWYNDTKMVTTVESAEELTPPETFRLEQNYPNPFNPSTTIAFGLPKRSRVRLEIYDLLGRKAATLVDDELAAGRHQIRFEAQGLASGVYFYQIMAEGFKQSKKFLLLR